MGCQNGGQARLANTYRCDAYPTWKEETTIAEPAYEREGARCDVGIYGVNGEEADDGCLRGVVD